MITCVVLNISGLAVFVNSALAGRVRAPLKQHGKGPEQGLWIRVWHWFIGRYEFGAVR